MRKVPEMVGRLKACILIILFSASMHLSYGQTNKKTIIFFGNSLTAGYGLDKEQAFPPNSSTKTSTGWLRIQSIRVSPPAVVSPLKPAFTTRYLKPLLSSFSWIRAGRLCTDPRIWWQTIL